MTRRQRLVRTAFWTPLTLTAAALWAHALITYPL